MNMTSNCDVTNSAQKIQMTTICLWCLWMNSHPMKILCVRHCIQPQNTALLSGAALLTPPALTLPSTTPCRRVRSQLFLSPTPVLFQEVGILILDRQLRHSNTASLTSITQFTNVIWHHVVLRLILIVDWWVAMVVDWCPAVHDTSGATAPLSHVGNWCELYYFLQTFTKIHIMIVVASNTKKGIWESWSWNTNKTVVGSNPVCSKCADSCRTRVLKSGCCTPLSRCELWLDACIQHQRRVFLSTHGSNLLSFVVKEPHYI